MKKYLPQVVLAFAVSFMMFIYEPIVMYANNINDFWFDLKILLKPSVVMFIAAFLMIFILYSLLYLIIKKVTKKNKMYHILLIAGYILFITSYIEGNYLAGLLPALDGSFIDWSKYTKASLTSFVILLVITILVVIIYKKYKDKTINILKYISMAICAMLSVSLLTTITSTDALKSKEYSVTATTKNLDAYSEEDNFIILLLDATDSVMYNEIVESNSKYKTSLKDFTYYPDTISGYPFTRDSIPFILSGMWNNNENDFKDYYIKAMDSSPLIKELKSKKYNINIYDTEILYNSENASIINNLSFNCEYNTKSFMKQELKYVLFKYLPFYLKKYANIESMNFNNAKKVKGEVFDLNDRVFYNTYLNNFSKSDDKQFKFIHLEGAHVPFDLDKNLNSIMNGTYKQKLEATVNLTEKYLNYLKENDVYDNSNIIIMADHGYNVEDIIMGRQNPILYIKCKNETHENMIISDKAISYEDLTIAYNDLLNNKKGNEVFKDISSNRERRYIWYEYGKENRMVEYVQKGKAWNNDTLVPTGREFNR